MPPTLLTSISRLPWLLAAWLANGWLLLHGPLTSNSEGLALINWADCVVEFIKDFFLLLFVFWRKDNQIGTLDIVSALAKLTTKCHLKIFDKCPAWSWVSDPRLVLYLLCHLCYCFSVHGRAYRAQSLCIISWAISQSFVKYDFVIQCLTFNWTLLWTTSNFNSSWRKTPCCPIQHFLRSCETHSYSGILVLSRQFCNTQFVANKPSGSH